ncbi:hypothetical protein [Aliiroseovarius subalbicans]|uniref:hypothetical protein n=1 Tax=Aliiroseovarius subalbicans TaxID=2925840 RepID=UPI001F583BCC|nr:hypothetical protein [Aliiroseovarius subalbicans]
MDEIWIGSEKNRVADLIKPRHSLDVPFALESRSNRSILLKNISRHRPFAGKICEKE